MRHISTSSRKRRPPIAVAVVVGLALAAGPAALAASFANAPPGPTPPPMRVPASAAATIVDELAATGSVGQAPALADHQVTRAEYRAAAQHSADCLQAAVDREVARRALSVTAGVTEPRFSADGFAIDYSVTVRARPGQDLADLPPSLMDVPGELDERCRAAHLSATEVAYQTLRLSDPLVVASMTAGFNSCRRAAGLPVNPELEVRRDVAATLDGADHEPSSALVDCLTEYPSVAALPAG